MCLSVNRYRRSTDGINANETGTLVVSEEEGKWNVADLLDKETIRSNVLSCLKFRMESKDQQKSAEMRTSISDHRRTQQSVDRCSLFYCGSEFRGVIAPYETQTADIAYASPLQSGSAYSESVTSRHEFYGRLFAKLDSKYFEIFVGLFTIHNFNLTSGTTLYCLRKPILFFCFRARLQRFKVKIIPTSFSSSTLTPSS